MPKYHVVIPYLYHSYVTAGSEAEAIDQAYNEDATWLGGYAEENTMEVDDTRNAVYVEEIK